MPAVAAASVLAMMGVFDFIGTIGSGWLSDRFDCRWLREPRSGKSRALNRGLREAKGEVLLFTDDDLRFPRQWIEPMMAPILAGEADAVAGVEVGNVSVHFEMEGAGPDDLVFVHGFRNSIETWGRRRLTSKSRSAGLLAAVCPRSLTAASRSASPAASSRSNRRDASHRPANGFSRSRPSGFLARSRASTNPASAANCQGA